MLARIRWWATRPFRYDSETGYQIGDEVFLKGFPGDEKLVKTRVVREEKTWLCEECREEFPTIRALLAHSCSVTKAEDKPRRKKEV